MFEHLASIIGLNTTWYSVAIKKPNTKEYLYWDSYKYPQKTQFLHGIDINLWLQIQHGRTGQTWTNWLFYNDQLPDQIKECAFLKGINNSGHCKGIVVWNNKKVGWLIHSIPKFPASNGTGAGTTFRLNNLHINDAELKYAQSMIYIEMPVKYKTEIVRQIAMMDAQLYEFKGDATITEETVHEMFNETLTKRKATQIMRMPLWGVSAYHCAKNRNYCRDFYENIACLRSVTAAANDRGGHFGASFRNYKTNTQRRRNAIFNTTPTALVTQDKIPILCETWTNGEGRPLENNEYVKNISNFAIWKSTCDHSKWAISYIPEHDDTSISCSYICCYNRANANLYRVCIGDLNHMTSQMIRGGGGIVIDGNKALWMCFYNNIRWEKDF